MVLVTRLSGQELVLNCDLIEKIEATPDTVITLSGGSNYMVREGVQEVVDRIIAFRSAVIRAASFPDPGDPSPKLRVVKPVLAEEE
ncbi:Flagellar [mine drainage metagenome]|uniref:Flagellar n=1 Tax=mine drainage metagenome TaxID=410659 RepID=T0Z6E9_9ZZZZ